MSVSDTYKAYDKNIEIILKVNYDKKEIAYLKEAFRNRKIEVHKPSYIHEGYVHGKNDIGNTYIEVDMSNQKLYAYLEGELIVETDIVTGNMKNRTSTRWTVRARCC